MDYKIITENVEDYTASYIADFLYENNLSYEVLSDTIRNNGGWDTPEKRRNVLSLLMQKDHDSFKIALEENTEKAFRDYISLYDYGSHISEAEIKIQEIKKHERFLQEIIEDVNEYTPDEIIIKLNSKELDDLCLNLRIDAQLIKGYREPILNFNDIPKSINEVPDGYTDIYFWGIPSSGKTCALSAILSTIKKDFSMEAPDCEKKFGATYRDSLVNIFAKDIGYLPGRTNQDRTQYMPFLFYKRGEKKKRKISFFELSGEVFKYFYEVANNSQIIKDYSRDDIEKSFNTLELLLKSNNQKIHFFFID